MENLFDFNTEIIGIKLIECKNPNYPGRTIENVENSDATLAIARDFSTRGEVLTKILSVLKLKPYIPMKLDFQLSKERSWKLIERIEKVCEKLGKNKIILNIAGNGIYSLPDLNQDDINDFVFEIVSPAKNLLAEIVSGGQTGVDEAGVFAALKSGIKCTCVTPKGFRFRDKNNQEIYGADKFIERFKKYL